MEIDEAGRRYLAGETNNPEVLDALERGSDEHGRQYYLLYKSVIYRETLNDVPKRLKKIIKKEAWKRWHWIGSDFQAASLTEYLTKHPPKGSV